MQQLYCKLFIDVSLHLSGLVKTVMTATQGTSSHGTVDCNWGTLDIRENDEYSRRKKSGPDGFLFYRYIVDIELIRASTDRDHYILGIKSLIQYLKTKDAKVVAACEFEEQLQTVD